MKSGVATLLTLVGLVSASVWHGARTAPQPASGDEHFKYGSIGAEPNEGVPYWLWQAMPVVCADRLGGAGLSAVGILWEPGHELPIGFSKRSQFGGDRVAINCALCHTATYRPSAADPRRIVVGGPATLTSPQAYFRFLTACAKSDDFTPDKILAAVDTMTTLGWTERAMYRFVFIPATKAALAKRAAAMAWSDRQPDWGPGRVDPFNPLKFGLLAQPADATVGASDMVPLWNMGARKGMGLHWDGINESLHELMLSSGLANGATTKSIDLESLARMERWMREQPPPKYPFPVDQPLASRGAQVFTRECASCHAIGGPRVGTVIPIDEIGTDPHRVDSWTAAGAAALNALAEGTTSDIDGFRKTNGYVAVPLDAIWLRAPYLHNGSVPTLAHLLAPAAERPRGFLRGYDVFDQVAVGFVASGPDAERSGFRFDTALAGNGNGGHQYGVTLPSDQKTALLEFLKTQ